MGIGEKAKPGLCCELLRRALAQLSPYRNAFFPFLTELRVSALLGV